MSVSYLKSDDILENNIKLPNKKARRQKRKRLNKQSRKEFKKNTKLSFTMSSWAETFTIASNWQIKHQLAYWKARAKALEYENSILHDIIRKNYLAPVSNEENGMDESATISDNVNEDAGDENQQDRGVPNVNGPDGDDMYVSDKEEENDDFEVSEEFIEFLRANAKYKEEARLERERLKAQQEAQDELIQHENSDMNVMGPEKLKELYGEKWQRISALQMSLMTDFMNKTDESKPVHWPNIPFNFSYS